MVNNSRGKWKKYDHFPLVILQICRMIKKLSCLLLLFSFLLVKSAPLYAAVFNQTEQVTDQQEEEIPEQEIGRAHV